MQIEAPLVQPGIQRSFLRLRRRLLQPRDVEGVVILAADELDQIIARLAGGEVAGGLGHGVTENEIALVHTGQGAFGATGSDEFLHGPGLAFVEGHRGEQSVAGELAAVGGFERHAFSLAPVALLVGERAEEQRALVQSHQHSTLHTADGGELASLELPRFAPVAAVPDGRAEVERFLLLGRIDTTEGNEAPVGKLFYGVVYTRVAHTRHAGPPVGLPVRRGKGPRLAAVPADVEICTGLVAIQRENDRALARADGLVANLGLGLKRERLGPCLTAVCRR